MLHAAVRFIFDLHGSSRRSPISLYLKSLHILPIKFRIIFKIAVLIYKCFHNFAPAYLNDTLTFRKLSVTHNVRSNNDLLKLEPKLELNFVKSKAMFVIELLMCGIYYLCQFVQLSVRHSDTVSQFKKSHYFSLAFRDVHEL